jgi:hypothetical protein
MQAIKEFENNDAIFDVTWSEHIPNLILSGCGDGVIKIFDIN